MNVHWGRQEPQGVKLGTRKGGLGVGKFVVRCETSKLRLMMHFPTAPQRCPGFNFRAC